MGWTVLLLAGLVEVVWAQSIRPTENFTRPLPTLACFALGASAVYLLSRAMNTLPVGTAYAVFTGIGAVGTVLVGVVVHKESVGILRMTALTLIVAGVTLARFAHAE
jgi:quaternary ammonium compound-resistance protein SugE